MCSNCSLGRNEALVVDEVGLEFTRETGGLLKRLEISEAVTAKSIRPDTDAVAILVAEGKAEIGVIVLTQIMTTPGVELAGPLPKEIQSHVSFVGGVSQKSTNAEAAARLLAFLKQGRAVAIIRSQGMEAAP